VRASSFIISVDRIFGPSGSPLTQGPLAPTALRPPPVRGRGLLPLAHEISATHGHPCMYREAIIAAWQVTSWFICVAATEEED
jgi:hypothetical protein